MSHQSIEDVILWASPSWSTNTAAEDRLILENALRDCVGCYQPLTLQQVGSLAGHPVKELTEQEQANLMQLIGAIERRVLRHFTP